MAKGKNSARGALAPIMTAFWLIVIAGGIIGWAKANDLHSPADVWNYAKSWSDKADECYGDNPKEKIWVCDGTAPPSDGTPTTPDGPSVVDDETFRTLEAKLKSITTAPEQKIAYDRAEWKHWTDLDGNKCNSREDVLLKQGKNVKTAPGDNCKPISGEWVSPYDNIKFTDPSKMDIDHVIPLSWAAKNGGQSWPAAKKEAFANDFSQLIATSASANRGKGDKGPSKYMPSETSYWCSYSQVWINTAAKYNLSMPAADKAKLEEGLATC